MEPILVVNAGSSSVKFQIFAIEGSDELTLQIKGQVDGIGTEPRLRARGPGRVELVDRRFDRKQIPDVPAALQASGAWLRQQYNIDPIAIGHRVVHGGSKFDCPVLVDAEVLATPANSTFHSRHCISPTIWRRSDRSSDVLRVCRRSPVSTPLFIAATARSPTITPCPERFYAEGVRRYGFHGLSYEYIAQRLPEVAPDIAGGRVIVAHLGSGASMCALADGRSVESTMGFTALDGLPMGTRPGQLDPGVVLLSHQSRRA